MLTTLERRIMKEEKDLTVPPTPRLRAVRLRTIRDCYRELGKLYNALRRDEVDGAKAGRLAFILGLMIRTQTLARQEEFAESMEFVEDSETGPDETGEPTVGEEAAVEKLKAVLARAKRMEAEGLAASFRSVVNG